ncbi:hypothetical protein NW754_010976 [Fusarium falciforme]|nr:hypothetical protein NW754_010976 [Fusarium falciforme]KAJ4258523.1 hypothetical protein NW757_003091 [Fusarium falciforme]
MDLKEDLLSLIPTQFTQTFSEWIKVNNTPVAIYVGKIDPKKAGLDNPKLPPAPDSKGNTPSSSIQAGISVSTTIQLTEKFGLVKKWIGKDELELEGHISNQSAGMNARISTQLAFGGKDARAGEYPI